VQLWKPTALTKILRSKIESVWQFMVISTSIAWSFRIGKTSGVHVVNLPLLSDRKFDITESEIVAQLFKMFEKLTERK
jgi:hypothetical protein